MPSQAASTRSHVGSPALLRIGDEELQFVVGVVRIMVEEEQPLDLRHAGKVDDVCDGRMAPSDVVGILAVSVLGVMEQHVGAMGQVVTADPFARAPERPTAEPGFVIGQVDDGAPLFLDAVANGRALVGDQRRSDRQRADVDRPLGRVVKFRGGRGCPPTAPERAAARDTSRSCRPATARERTGPQIWISRPGSKSGRKKPRPCRWSRWRWLSRMSMRLCRRRSSQHREAACPCPRRAPAPRRGRRAPPHRRCCRRTERVGPGRGQ